MISSIDVENKIQHPFIIKTLQRVAVEGTCFNVVKAVCEMPTANSILSGEKQKTFPVRSGVSQEYPLLPLSFNVVLEVLATIIRQEKRKKGNPDWKGRGETVTYCR